MSFPPSVTRDLVLERAAELLAADDPPHHTTLYIVVHDTVDSLLSVWQVEDHGLRMAELTDEVLEHVGDFLGIRRRGYVRSHTFVYKMHRSTELAELLAQARKHERVTFRQRLAWWFGRR